MGSGQRGPAVSEGHVDPIDLDTRRNNIAHIFISGEISA